MPITIATRTLRLFEECVARDGGNAFRANQQRVLPHMHDAYRQEHDPFRTHLGASLIGRDCARELWLGFRWATRQKAEGRMYRLWNRGHLEEGRLIALLLTIGCEVFQQDENGNQYRISAAGGHYGGSGDGVFRGCPDLPPGTFALCEFKTHNLKSFSKLAGTNWEAYHAYHVLGRTNGAAPQFEGDGLRTAKFEHYVQMQQYMRKMQLGVGVYFASSKNDDHIYAEVVHLDTESADKYEARGVSIALSPNAPERISKTPGWYGCRFCDQRMVCHYGTPPEKNCRTCQFSEPKSDGTWWCKNEERQMTMLFGPKDGISTAGETLQLTKERQLAGCSMWVKHKDI